VPYITNKYEEKSKKYKKSDAEDNYKTVNSPLPAKKTETE
jgi:hypothetical protein